MARPDNVTVAKTAMSSTDLATAGALNDQQFNEFFDLVRDQPTLLSDIDFQPMTALKAKLESYEFGGSITFKGREGVAATTEQRGALVASKVELDAQLLQCEISVTEKQRLAILIRDNLDNYARTKMAMQFALDQETAVVTAVSGVGYLLTDAFDGLIEQVPSGNVIDMTSNTQKVTDDAFFQAFLTIEAKYRRDKANMRIYCASDVLAAYNKYITTRQTGLGDIRIVDGTQKSYWNGILMWELPSMPDGSFLMTNRHNCVWGVVNNDVIPYMDTEPSAGIWLYGLRMYGDVKYREAEAAAYYKGLDALLSITTV